MTNENKADFRDKVQGLAGDLDASAVISDWLDYFYEYNIAPGWWEREFDAIVHARLLAGVVSIAAPTDAEKGDRGE